MKRQFFLYLLVALLMMIMSCGRKTATLKQFPLEQSVFPTYIGISELIKIGNIYKIDKYFILRNSDPNAEYFFYVYSYPDFKFLYSFCPRGNGAGEFLMPTVIKNTSNDLFMFRDHATDDYVTFQLADTCAVLIEKYHFKPDDYRFFWEINLVKDSLFVLKRSSAKLSTRELWDFSSRSLLDTLPNTFNLAEKMGKEYYTEFDDMWISAYEDHVAFAYFFIDRIEIGKVKDRTLKLENYVGVENAPDFYLFNKNVQLGGKYKYNVDYNIVYYEDVVAAKNNIYALYAGIPWGEIDNKHSSIIEIYNWHGKPLKMLHLKQSISSIVVDEENSRIFAINPESHEDSILVYNYK